MAQVDPALAGRKARWPPSQAPPARTARAQCFTCCGPVAADPLPALEDGPHYFRRWRLEGVWARVHGRLRSLCRQRAGRSARPTAAIIDSQSARTTERGGPHGYDAGKKINGRKRHILVDSSGLVLCAHVHPADIADRDGAVPLLTAARRRFGSLRSLWADMGYRGRLVKWV